MQVISTCEHNGAKSQMYLFIFPIEIQEEHVDNIAVDKKRVLMAAIFRMWERTLNDKERQILIKKFLPPQFAQKPFKDTSLLENLWAVHVTSNGQSDFRKYS